MEDKVCRWIDNCEYIGVVVFYGILIGMLLRGKYIYDAEDGQIFFRPHIVELAIYVIIIVLGIISYFLVKRRMNKVPELQKLVDMPTESKDVHRDTLKVSRYLYMPKDDYTRLKSHSGDRKRTRTHTMKGITR